MSAAPPRRGVFAVFVVALVALICLLVGHEWLQGYLDEQRAKHPASAAAVPASSGAAGLVVFADGSPAAAARVGIVWRDSGGRPGSTPAVTDDAGRFVQGNIPAHGSITEIHAAIGPLAGKAEPSALPRDGAPGAGVKITLPAEFRLAGLVRRAGDRAAIAGATLEIAGVRATSGADGEFKIEHVAASVLREERPVVHIAAAGFRPLDWPMPKDALPETYGDLTILMETSK